MKKKSLLIIVILFVGFRGAFPVFPENTDAITGGGFYLGITSDAFLGLDLGYTHTFSGRINFSACGRLRLPLLLAVSDGTLDTFEFAAGAAADVPVKGPFILSGGLEIGHCTTPIPWGWPYRSSSPLI